MFGYVKAFKPELKVIEYETYKAVYCSLCHRLGKNFGLLARFTINYDFVFLAMLLMGVSEKCPGFKKSHCPFNPLVKCKKIDGECEEMDFTTDAAAIMLYYKLKDSIYDKGLFGKIPLYLIYPFFARARKKAAKRRGELDSVFSKYIKDQNELEKNKTISIDAACEPSAVALSKTAIMFATDESLKRILSRLGYCIGKWIYLADALDDLDNDIKHGAYNVIALKYNLNNTNINTSDEYKEKIILEMNVCICEAVSAFELLEVKRFRPILCNILYQGLPQVQKNLKLKGKAVNEGSV